jgi:hypothetical protein
MAPDAEILPAVQAEKILVPAVRPGAGGNTALRILLVCSAARRETALSFD